MDPDCAEFVARVRERRLPRYETMTPDQARSGMEAVRKAAQLEVPAVGEVRELVIPADGHTISARQYRPMNAGEKEPALVFFHGGGWVLGDLDSHDLFCRRLTNASGCSVVAVDYRLAPEHKFPSAIDDAALAVKWVAEHAAALNVDGTRLAVGGDSAGGNLAAVMAHLSRDGKLPRLAFQLLLYPIVELTFARPSHQLEEDGVPVLGPTLIWFRDHYLADPSQRTDWRASPLMATRFDDLPSAYIVTAGLDPACDEGIAYVARLRDARIPVTHRHFPGQIHAFLTIGPMFPTTKTAVRDIGQELSDALASPGGRDALG